MSDKKVEMNGDLDGLTPEQITAVEAAQQTVSDTLHELFPKSRYFVMVMHDDLRRTSLLMNQPLGKMTHMLATWLTHDKEAKEALRKETEGLMRQALRKLLKVMADEELAEDEAGEQEQDDGSK